MRPSPNGHDAARRSYDTVAAGYDREIGDELTGKPLDRALLAALAEHSGDGIHLQAAERAVAFRFLDPDAETAAVHEPG